MQTAEFVLQQESALLTTFTVRLNPSVWITDFSLLAQVFFIQRCHESFKASETTIRISSQCMYDFSIAFQEMSVSK